MYQILIKVTNCTFALRKGQRSKRHVHVSEFEQKRPKLTTRKRRKINSRTQMYLFMKASRVVLRVFGFARNRWLNTLYGIVWKTKYGRFTTLNIPKCEHFTLLVCPLRCLVISVIRRLGNVRSFKTYMFHFWTFCHERDPTLTRLHGKLSPQLTGLPYLNVIKIK